MNTNTEVFTVILSKESACKWQKMKLPQSIIKQARRSKLSKQAQVARTSDLYLGSTQFECWLRDRLS